MPKLVKTVVIRGHQPNQCLMIQNWIFFCILLITSKKEAVLSYQIWPQVFKVPCVETIVFIPFRISKLFVSYHFHLMNLLREPSVVEAEKGQMKAWSTSEES